MKYIECLQVWKQTKNLSFVFCFSFCLTFKTLVLSFFKTLCVKFFLSFISFVSVVTTLWESGPSNREQTSTKTGNVWSKKPSYKFRNKSRVWWHLVDTSYQMNIFFWLCIRVFSFFAMNFTIEHSVKWDILLWLCLLNFHKTLQML